MRRSIIFRKDGDDCTSSSFSAAPSPSIAPKTRRSCSPSGIISSHPRRESQPTKVWVCAIVTNEPAQVNVLPLTGGASNSTDRGSALPDRRPSSHKKRGRAREIPCQSPYTRAADGKYGVRLLSTALRNRVGGWANPSGSLGTLCVVGSHQPRPAVVFDIRPDESLHAIGDLRYARGWSARCAV